MNIIDPQRNRVSAPSVSLVEPTTNPAAQPATPVSPSTNPRMRVIAPSASAVAGNPATTPVAPVPGPDNRVVMPTPAEIAAAAAKQYEPTDNKFQAFNQGFANAQALRGKTQREVDAENRKLEKAEREKEKQVAFLRKTDPEMAAAVDAGVLDAQTAYTTSRSAKAGKWSLQKMDNGDLVRVNETTGEWKVLANFADPEGSDNGAPSDLGLNPQYGVDQQGNPVLIQLGKNGHGYQTQLPDGVTLSKEPIKLDAGTHYVLLDPITRARVGEVAKNVAGEEADKAAGKAQGEAQAALPAAEGAANELLSSIDSLYNDPYLGSMLGPVNSRLPNVYSDSARVQAKMDQIGGQSFLQAFNTLRGAGQITEVEGSKATAAMARLNTAQNEKDYKAALDDLRGVVSRAVERSRQKAGQSVAPPAPQSQGSGYRDPKVSQSSAAGVLDRARKAIKAGAPPEEVKQRLIDGGIDPAGL